MDQQVYFEKEEIRRVPQVSQVPRVSRGAIESYKNMYCGVIENKEVYTVPGVNKRGEPTVEFRAFHKGKVFKPMEPVEYGYPDPTLWQVSELIRHQSMYGFKEGFAFAYGPDGDAGESFQGTKVVLERGGSRIWKSVEPVWTRKGSKYRRKIANV